MNGTDYAYVGDRHEARGPTTGDDSDSVLTESSPLLRRASTTSRCRFPSMASTLCPDDPSDREKVAGRAPPPSPLTGQSSGSATGSAHDRNGSTTDSAPSQSPPSSPQPPSLRTRRRRLQKLRRFSPSLTLENSGSVARDHLASERTFLAYVRTSLAIASAGVALVQLFTLSKSSTSIASYARPLGAITVALAFAVLLIGFVRFFTIQNALTRGKFPVARATVAGMSLALAGVVVVVFAVILAVAG
ncbi:hypothetical protein HWV62_33497 [Athelia sp. TMB]|nr:hypothetical protein HWV62_33497 [Athelia sp. TMB]